MAKELGVDGRGRLLTRRRRFLNFLHIMFSVLKPPKRPPTEAELEERRKEDIRRATERVLMQDRCD